MINQVVSNNVPKNTFREFSQPQQGWYLNTPKIEEKKKHHIMPTIVASALVIGFGTLAIMKGALPKKLAPFLEKLKIKLEQKAKEGGRLSNFYKKSTENVTEFMNKAQSVNNITSLKDIIFQKLMFLTSFTKKIHTGITSFFGKIARKTVNSSYSRTEQKLAEINEYVLSLNEKILSKNPDKAETVEALKLGMNKVNEKFAEGFGTQARTERLARLEKATENLYDYMWNASYSDIKNFRSKNMYQTFIAEEKMLPFKTELNKEISNLSRNIYKQLDKNLSEYKNLLPEKQYKALEAKITAWKKSLNYSAKNETTKYVDKARDLKLGSAPTDILSILFTTGTVGWYVGKSKDRDERISSTLKYGIPAIGAVATTLLCTAKLIAGSKSMAIGLLSGWLMNKAGNVVDQLRKKYTLDISLERKSIIKPQSDNV